MVYHWCRKSKAMKLLKLSKF
ncbi:hypothetical protein Goshw_028105 [Gossypium schwendimanii]|uniref:Uncharacterized protein n=3 Tax=Gossypium TaxID=3633 RepID=A0A7J8P7Y4_GOSRA|nr:hypothetical protein [Gossypium raimondii]MBA0764887.1 hypothetical protein [Gossypium trilobum]MBA0856413.1 hypothetical protein [Gossypium schwendimanii]